MPARHPIARRTLTAGGSIKSSKTTPFMTIAKDIEAMKKATASGYAPPAPVAGV